MLLVCTTGVVPQAPGGRKHMPGFPSRVDEDVLRDESTLHEAPWGGECRATCAVLQTRVSCDSGCIHDASQ